MSTCILLLDQLVAGERRGSRRQHSQGAEVGGFFFSSRRRHTRYIGDWSSDVCSSDLVGKARDWIAAHRAEMTLSLRITVAGLIALAIGELLGVTQVYWAVLTAVIVMQASVGGSLKATIDRLAGTAAGALWGAALGTAIPHPGALATGGLLAAALLPLAALVARWPSYRVAPVTAIIVLLVPHGDAGPVQAAIERLIEIALGCAVALGVALAITPSRAHRLLSAAAADALTPMREQFLLLLAGITEPVQPAAVLALHDRIRSAIERYVVAAGDALRERTRYLTNAPDPEPFIRAASGVSSRSDHARARFAEPVPACRAGHRGADSRGIRSQRGRR